MLIPYRRHLKSCPHRNEGRKYRRCRCPIWADGFLNGVEIRESLDLRDWEKAQERIREWEAEGRQVQTEAPITVDQACDEFLVDAEARKLREATLEKYRLLFDGPKNPKKKDAEETKPRSPGLKEFARTQGVRFLQELNLGQLRKFRALWRDGNFAALKKLERLRAFFGFAQESGWTAENPAKRIKSPTVTQPPTMPFTREQMVDIFAACEKYKDNYGRTGQSNGRRLRTFVLALRYSGLRIRDVVTLPKSRIVNGRLFLYTAKTGTPVFCPLPAFVSDALEACPSDNETYFFWTGQSQPKSAVGDWQRSLRKLFVLAGIPDGHAHRFRDTFAVELLLAGVPLERVSMLLGHRSLKVTEKHYAPWVRARQEQLEADVRRSWGEDPMALELTKGTPEVHEKQEAVN
jgi:integrase/recombinase XerD